MNTSLRPDTSLRPGAVRKEAALFAADLALFATVIPLAANLRFRGDVPWDIALSYWTFYPALVAFLAFGAYAAGLYDFRHKLTWTDHGFAGCGAALLGVGPGYLLLALVQLYGFDYVSVSRLALVYQIVLLILWFGVSRGILLAVLARRGYRVRVALLGPHSACEQLSAEILDHAPKLVQLEGIVPLDDAPGGAGIGLPENLEDIVRERRVDQIILVQIDLPQKELRDLLRRCDRTGAELYLYPDLNLGILVNTRVSSIAGLPLVSLRPAFDSHLYRQGKRIFDVLTALALLILALPLLLIAMLLVKFTSRGPVLFRQERLGLHGRPFTLAKLRTMYMDAEHETGPALSSSGDPRVTPVGRWLRKWRVDEIPQLLNVLRGEMSIVGPRPERRAFIEQFIAENPLYERRLMVRPGLTGLAQIHGRYDTDYVHKLRYDLIYINGISLLTDLRILLATVQTVLTGKGAL